MESAAAATPDTIISVTTDQEYVQEVPSESQVPLVHSGEEGDIVSLNESGADVMENMLPKYVIIQSNLNDMYVHLYTENPDVPNALRYTGDYSFDLDTRFEVEPATTGSGLVHIRCLRNNKYWANLDKGMNWVTAMADKPEENQSDENCTLFQPVFVDSTNINPVVKLRHVNTGDYVRLFYGADVYDHALCLWPDEDKDTCTFIDWEYVLMLPDLIRIKNPYQGQYLRATDGDTTPLVFSGDADNSLLYDYEVSPSRNGGIRLKSILFGTYWTVASSSVVLTQASTTVHDTGTVFLPTIVDGNRILIRCLKNGLFCTGMSSQLQAMKNYPDDKCYMEIEEPVLSRKISNVIYHLSDARLYNEKNLALVTDDTSNNSDKISVTSELNLKTIVKNTTKWSTSVSFTVGFSLSITFGIPFIESGDLEISAEVTKSSEWGGEEETSLEIGSVKTEVVPPLTRLKGSYMATRCSYDIPFSYTQHDLLMNGNPRTTGKSDGLFTGNNGYDYQYELDQLPLEDGGDD